MENRPAVIIPLDGSRTATVAMGAAQSIASKMDAVLYIVHVAEERLSEDRLATELNIAGNIKIKDYSIKQIIDDNPVGGILRFASSVDAQMIVMSTHGKTFNTDYLLGSTTLGIIERAVDPVMLIRPGSNMVPGNDWKPAKILVPQNGTPASASIMGQVFNLAKLTGASIDIINVGAFGEKPPTEVGTIRAPQYLDHPRYDWPAWAREFVERFLTQKPEDTKLTLHERTGNPAEAILEFANENNIDYINLAWHGKFGEYRAKVIKKLLKETEIPVVLMWARE
jgi:nucleotide-binding universal stress UspA family protein